MREVNTEAFDATVATTGGVLVCVFFRGVNCFNCEMAEKAMLTQSGAMHELGLKWLHANVCAHPELGRHFTLHGIPVSMFFHRGKKLGWVTSWHNHTRFAAAIANMRNKLADRPLV